MDKTFLPRDKINAIGKDSEIINEIRHNVSEQKENISFNDISDLKIDLELYGRV